MDTSTSLKMTSLAVQSLFSYVEEENLAAVKAHLDKFRDVDSRSDVSQPYHNKLTAGSGRSGRIMQE